MKKGLLIAFVALGMTGCYTMLYPPVEETYSPAAGDSAVVQLPDSVVSGGVTIYNQNQIILDDYYQDPYYYRQGYWGGYYYWDPYYYNPFGYYRDYRWWRRQYYHEGHSPSPVIPAPKTPRRETDYRNPVVPPPNLNPAAPTVGQIEPGKTESKPDSIQPQNPKPEDEKRALRSTEKPPAEPEKKPAPEPAKDEKKSRREKSRER